MLTLTSKIEDIRRELDEDEPRAAYWFIKAHHGEKQYERWRFQKGFDLLKTTDREWTSEPVEYLSRNGNRWMSYEHISKDGEGGVYTFLYSICWFETIGSVGCWVRSETLDGQQGCIHFTTHFFLRFAQRLRLDPNIDRRQMLLRFMAIQHHPLLLQLPPREGYKDTEFAIRYPGSWAFGSMKEHKGYRMITVRTYLTHPELNPARKKQLEKFRKLADDYAHELELASMKEKSKEKTINPFLMK